QTLTALTCRSACGATPATMHASTAATRRSKTRSPGRAGSSPKVGERDLVVAGVCEAKAAVGVAVHAEPSGGVGAGFHGVGQGVIESLEAVGDHGLHEVAEVGEMPVDPRRGDANLAWERRHIRGVIGPLHARRAARSGRM